MIGSLLVLFRGEHSGGTVSIEAYIQEETGDLILSGQSLNTWDELFGDMDCEYWLTVKSDQKKEVLTGLAAEAGGTAKDQTEPDLLLLRLLAKRFGHSEAVPMFMDWCAERGIRYEFYSYL